MEPVTAWEPQRGEAVVGVLVFLVAPNGVKHWVGRIKVISSIRVTWSRLSKLQRMVVHVGGTCDFEVPRAHDVPVPRLQGLYSLQQRYLFALQLMLSNLA